MQGLFAQSWFVKLILVFRATQEKPVLVRVCRSVYNAGRNHPIGRVYVNPKNSFDPAPSYWRLTSLQAYAHAWLEYAGLHRDPVLAHVTDLVVPLHKYRVVRCAFPSLLSLRLQPVGVDSPIFLATATSPQLSRLQLEDGYWSQSTTLTADGGLASLREIELPFPPDCLKCDDGLTGLTTLSCVVRSGSRELNVVWPAWLQAAKTLTTLRVSHVGLARPRVRLGFVGLEHIEHLVIQNTSSVEKFDGAGIAVCTRLTTLELKGVRSVPLSQTSATLRELVLIGCEVQPDAWPDLHCPALVTLRLKRVVMPHVFKVPLDANNLPCLRALEVDCDFVTLKAPLESATIASLTLANAPNQHVLSISLGQNPCLTNLSLCNVRVSVETSQPRNVADEAKADPLVPALRTLTLSSHLPGSQLVGRMMSECPTLRCIVDHSRIPLVTFPPSFRKWFVWQPQNLGWFEWQKRQGHIRKQVGLFAAPTHVTHLRCHVLDARELATMLAKLPNVDRLELEQPNLLALLPMLEILQTIPNNKVRRVGLRLQHQHDGPASAHVHQACLAARDVLRTFQGSVRTPEGKGELNCHQCWFVRVLLP